MKQDLPPTVGASVLSALSTSIILPPPVTLGTIILPPVPPPPPPSRPLATFGTNDQIADAGHNCLAFEDANAAQPCSTTFVADPVGISFGPVPAAGIQISNLYAVTDGSPKGDGSYAVDVLDNGVGAPILSCSVTASSVPAGTCTAAGPSSTISGGHFLTVRITNAAAAGSADPAHWRVSFNY